MTEELAVERLTYGFDALARRGRHVVFLPYAAPGDRVRAEIVEERAGYARGRVVEVLEPGAGRVLPGCRWFPTCGGCQWQHVAPAVQREAKAATVAEQLARGAGVRGVAAPAIVPSPADWGYRSRITLVVEGRHAGYHRARSHRLVEVAECPIAAPELSAHLAPVREWIASLRVPLARVTIAVAPGGVALAAAVTGRPGPPDVAATERLLVQFPTIRGAVLAGRPHRTVVGDPTVRVPAEADLHLEVPADVFTQVNLAANPGLVRTVLDAGGFAPGERVVDLHCGAGNFALPIARRGADVHGIERDPAAVDAARANAARLGLRATFEAASAADGLGRLAPDSVDAVVLDPPRTGAADAIAALAALRPRRIVYVSCDPATLARDVRALRAVRYRVEAFRALDLFPQTFHVESVTNLLLT